MLRHRNVRPPAMIDFPRRPQQERGAEDGPAITMQRSDMALYENRWRYWFEEGAPMSCIYACCCPFFSEIQIINQVHVTMPNHLKPFDVCFQMSLSGPSWPTLFTALPHPRPLRSQNGFSEMPTDSNQRARYVELLRGERRFGDRRA